MSQTKVKSGLIDFTEGIDSFIEFSGGNSTVTGDLTVTGTLVGYTPTASLNISNWDTAYGWGNHASAGYLTSFDITTQTDPKYLRSDESDTMTGSLTVTGIAGFGAGTQEVNSDANLTLRSGVSFSGLDFKSARTSGNIGGLRFFNTSSDTDAASQLLFETDGKLVFYNGTLGGEPRLTVLSTGDVGIGTTAPQGNLEVVGLSYFTRSSQSLLVNPNYGGANTHAQLQVIGNMALAFATNGDSERMRITSGGNVGIGTASPNAKLEVNGNIYTTSNTNFLLFGTNPAANPYIQGGSDNSLYIGTGNSSRVHINPSGNVGIGVNSPPKRLQINHDVNDWVTGIKNYGDNAYGLQVDLSGSTGGQLGYALGVYTQGGTGMFVRNDGNIGVGTTSPSEKLHIYSGTGNGPEIRLQNSTSSYYLRAYTDRLNILAYDGGYTYSEAVSIKSSNGFVGLGTTSPGALLHVYGNLSANPITFEGNGSSNSWVRFKAGATASTWQIGASSGSFIIYDELVDATRIHINSSGNVGIGTTSPSSKLHVVGNVGGGGILHLTDSQVESSIGYKINGGTGDVGWVTGNYNNDFFMYSYTSGSQVMTLKPSGNVGIGTTSPSRKLEIYAVNPALALKSSTSTGYSELYFADSDSDNIGFISYSHSNNELAIGTNGSARMRIDASGNIGIGGSSISFSNYRYLTINGGSTTQGGVLYLRTSDASHTGEVYVDSSGFHVSGNNANQKMFLKTVGTTRVTIDSAGKVGIGTTSPSQKLTVQDGYIRQYTNSMSTQTAAIGVGVGGGGGVANAAININTEFGIGSAGYVLVEITTSVYCGAGSGGGVHKWIAGGYSGHTLNSYYHKHEVIANNVTNVIITPYNPSHDVYGVTVQNNASGGGFATVEIRVTSTY